MTDEAREAAFETWADSRGYISTREAFDAGVAEGIRQAPEAAALDEVRAAYARATDRFHAREHGAVILGDLFLDIGRALNPLTDGAERG